MSDATPAAFTLERRFDAPPERVWAAWSQADELSRWWGPAGCAVEVSRFEFREGGHCHYSMRFAGAPAMWGRMAYREIEPQRRIVWLNSFATEEGGIARAPFAELCPLEVENTVSLRADGGATVLSLSASPFGANAAERLFFDGLRSSLEQGYGGTFDQLRDHLARPG